MFLALGAFGVSHVSAQDESEGSSAAPEEGPLSKRVGGRGNAAPADGGEAAPSGPGWSGPGFYFSLIKLFAGWIVVLMWVYSTDWVSRDAQEHKFDHLKWNPIVFAPFIVGVIAVLDDPDLLRRLSIAGHLPLGARVGLRENDAMRNCPTIRKY